MQVCRTRFKNDIVTEFVVPKNKKSQKVMIFCSGIPSVPCKDDVLEFWAKKGYWTFFPRYRGTWESKGTFLRYALDRDVLAVIDAFDDKFQDYWSNTTYRVKPKFITVVGSSFGGPAAILATRDPRVNKAVCISPVVDWRAEDKSEPLDELYNFLKKAYPNVYRLNKSTWNKLKKGLFYNPATHIKQLDPKKIMIFHAQNDDIVRFKPVEKFAKRIECSFINLRTGGHLSSSMLMDKKYFKKVKKFLQT